MYSICWARRKCLPSAHCFPGPPLIFLRFTSFSKPPYNQVPMERFTKLFGGLLLFVYHCFDRIVINGYLSGLSRPEQVVYFFRNVVGVAVIDKAVLSQRTEVYRNWGGSLRPQSQTSHRMGREGRPQGGLRAPPPAPD